MIRIETVQPIYSTITEGRFTQFLGPDGKQILRTVEDHKPNELAAFYSLNSAQSYLWQEYGCDYGQGDTPTHIVEACQLLEACEKQLRRELLGIVKQ